MDIVLIAILVIVAVVLVLMLMGVLLLRNIYRIVALRAAVEGERHFGYLTEEEIQFVKRQIDAQGNVPPNPNEPRVP